MDAIRTVSVGIVAILLTAAPQYSLNAFDRLPPEAGVDVAIETIRVESGASLGDTVPPYYLATAAYHRFTYDNEPLVDLNTAVERTARERIERFRNELATLAAQNATVATSDFVHELVIETEIRFLDETYISLEMTISEHRLLGTFYPDLERRFFSYDLSTGSILDGADLFAVDGYEAYMAQRIDSAAPSDVGQQAHPRSSDGDAVARALRDDQFYFDDTHLYVIIERANRSRRGYTTRRFTWRELEAWTAIKVHR